MNTLSDKYAGASECLERAIYSDRRFPKNIFVDDWDDFLFFDSDRIFQKDFVELVQDLLMAENSLCACISYLREPEECLPVVPQFLVSLETSSDEYQLVLSGSEVGSGWINEFGRFACVSDSCQWAFYCERANEVAVFAIRSGLSASRYNRVIETLCAKPIAEAFEIPISYGYTVQATTEQWRSELLREYQS